MKCKDIDFGTYACSYAVALPWAVDGRTVNIDKCLLPEIEKLWQQHIKTTGCCCGHGKRVPYIGVEPEYIERMKNLGYQVRNNDCRPSDEDSFIPKTILPTSAKR